MTNSVPVRSGSALVLFSGGQDSATCLAWALEHYARVETLGFDYGQRHRVELECRTQFTKALCEQFPDWGARLGDDHLLDLSVLAGLGETALTAEVAIRYLDTGLPNTIIPGRNLLFFTFAAALGYRRDLRTLIGGMCETDFSGYPDCRNDTLQTLASSLTLGMATPFEIVTPLMWLDKSQTWALAKSLGDDALVQMLIDFTHTCYLGIRSERHAWGYGCGECPACRLRSSGWQRWQEQRHEPA